MVGKKSRKKEDKNKKTNQIETNYYYDLEEPTTGVKLVIRWVINEQSKVN